MLCWFDDAPVLENISLYWNFFFTFAIAATIIFNDFDLFFLIFAIAIATASIQFQCSHRCLLSLPQRCWGWGWSSWSSPAPLGDRKSGAQKSLSYNFSRTNSFSLFLMTWCRHSQILESPQSMKQRNILLKPTSQTTLFVGVQRENFCFFETGLEWSPREINLFLLLQYHW